MFTIHTAAGHEFHEYFCKPGPAKAHAQARYRKDQQERKVLTWPEGREIFRSRFEEPKAGTKAVQSVMFNVFGVEAAPEPPQPEAPDDGLPY